MSAPVSPILRELDVSVVERDLTAHFAATTATAKPISLASLSTPSTALAASALRFAHDSLDSVMFNHSNRVYYIGKVMQQHPSLSSWAVEDESYFLTSLLHDIGLAPSLHLTTRLSFEYSGALTARDFILAQGGSAAVADETAEAIVRHTNFVQGKLSSTAQLIQLSTTLDVIGLNSALISPVSYAEIAGKWPRLSFNEHFARLMETEMSMKPWSHTTAVEEENGFCHKIRHNPFTESYDQW